MVKSFMTNMPDQCGAFLAASRIIERHQGNIVRVSYNKAVDAHALFLDVEADDAVLSAIEGELNQAGFLNPCRTRRLFWRSSTCRIIRARSCRFWKC